MAQAEHLQKHILLVSALNETAALKLAGHALQGRCSLWQYKDRTQSKDCGNRTLYLTIIRRERL